MGELIFSGGKLLDYAKDEVWSLTGALRWAQVPHTTTEPAKLQQQWRELYTDRFEWRDVPLVVLSAARSKGEDE